MIDYTALNDLALKTLEAKKRILKAAFEQPPLLCVHPEFGLIDKSPPPGDPEDYKIIAQWQYVIIAFGQLELEQVRRALEEYKCQNS